MIVVIALVSYIKKRRVLLTRTFFNLWSFFRPTRFGKLFKTLGVSKSIIFIRNLVNFLIRESDIVVIHAVWIPDPYKVIGVFIGARLLGKFVAEQRTRINEADPNFVRTDKSSPGYYDKGAKTIDNQKPKPRAEVIENPKVNQGAEIPEDQDAEIPEDQEINF